MKRDWPESNMHFTPVNAPIAVKANARKIPEWKLDSTSLVQEIQQSPTYTTAPVETVTLVPMGAQRIIISAFPAVSTNGEAHKWESD
ncbi:MAG: hypothetical protein ACLFM7_13080 [Bacteroidales bacterium]